MYETGLTALGGAAGGAGGAGLGALGRSPLLDLLAPLDYPRQALWNLARGPARLLSGDGDWQDVLGMAPGLVGALAAGPLGLLGGALAGGAAQGLGRATGSGAFEASRPEDVTGSQDFLPNLLLGAATDPLTYTGLGAGGGAGRQAGRRLAAAAAGPAVQFEPGALARAGVPPETLAGALRAGVDPSRLEAAAGAGLAGRNQALGEAVGDVARNRVGGLGRQTGDLAAALEARPEAMLSRGALTPEEAFAQMLPDYERLQKVERARANPRNAPLDDLDLVLNPGGPGMNMEARAQYIRSRAVEDAHRAAERALEERWGPAAAHLASTGQLGPIEQSLQARWGGLADWLREAPRTPAEALPRIEAAQLRQDAFPHLFEHTRGPQGPPVWAGQQEAANYLLRELHGRLPEAASLHPRDVLEALRSAGGTEAAAGLPREQRRLAEQALNLSGEQRVRALGEVNARQEALRARLLGMSGSGDPARAALRQELDRLQEVYRRVNDAGAPPNWWEPGVLEGLAREPRQATWDRLFPSPSPRG